MSTLPGFVFCFVGLFFIRQFGQMKDRIFVDKKKNTGIVLYTTLNPVKSKLNPICHLQALLGAHHILHISRIRVKRVRVAFVAIEK